MQKLNPFNSHIDKWKTMKTHYEDLSHILNYEFYRFARYTRDDESQILKEARKNLNEMKSKINDALLLLKWWSEEYKYNIVPFVTINERSVKKHGTSIYEDPLSWRDFSEMRSSEVKMVEWITDFIQGWQSDEDQTKAFHNLKQLGNLPEKSKETLDIAKTLDNIVGDLHDRFLEREKVEACRPSTEGTPEPTEDMQPQRSSTENRGNYGAWSYIRS